MSEHLSDVEAAEFIVNLGGKLSVRTLRNWRNTRQPDQPTYLKKDGRLYYTGAELEQWLTARGESEKAAKSRPTLANLAQRLEQLEQRLMACA